MLAFSASQIFQAYLLYQNSGRNLKNLLKGQYLSVLAGCGENTRYNDITKVVILGHVTSQA